MRNAWILILIFTFARLGFAAADENEQISRFERAAMNRESAAESYRLEAEKMAKDSDYLVNSMAPSATNVEQRSYYVDSAGVKYEKAGDLMLMSRRQYQMAMTNWGNAERDYRLWEDADLKVARAVTKVDESRLEAFRCAGQAADYFEAAAEQYGDVEKFEKQGTCFTKASLMLEELAKERARPIRKKMVTESLINETGGAR
jgi:hypothetical protein